MVYMDTNNITLIGMPGAGKSTLGVVLAKRLGMRFVDTDLLIQEGTGKLLSELLEERGVDGFIELENSMLKGLHCERHVISTGGSAVYGDEAMEHLRSMGLVVFLDITLEELHKRLNMDLLERGVVVRSGNTLDDLYNERAPLYAKYADVVLDTTGMNTLEAIDALCDVVARGLEKQ